MQIIKGNQSEMKTSEMSILEGINWVDEEKDQITNIDGGEAEDTRSEWQEVTKIIII